MEIRGYEMEVKALYGLLDDVMNYLHSDKFTGLGNGYVNVVDIITRIQQGKSAILDELLGADFRVEA